MPNETTPDFEALKARMKATWMAGDFGRVAKSLAYSRTTPGTVAALKYNNGTEYLR